MSEVFADTGYWIAMLNPGDGLNARAREVSSTLQNETIVTTEMVFTELLNHESRAGANKRRLTAQAVTTWTARTLVEVVPQTSEQFQRALELYRARPDHAWSLVDCASFIVMEERGITEALAFDRHFQQAGFTALLRDRE